MGGRRLGGTGLQVSGVVRCQPSVGSFVAGTTTASGEQQCGPGVEIDEGDGTNTNCNSGGMVAARQLNRATLARQSLLERADATVPDMMRRIVAVQAQDPASPYVALCNRIAEFDPADLDAAFGEHTVVKASLMRITLHAVHADDYTPFHTAMTPALRASRLNDPRFSDTGWTIADADAVLPHLAAMLVERRTRPEIEAALADHLDAEPHARVWWALRTFAPIFHAPTDAIWSFGREPAYVRAPDDDRPSEIEATAQLIRRYLAGFGPASAADVNQFSMLPRSILHPAFESLEGELVGFAGPDGTTLLDIDGGELPDPDVPAPPRLMAMWDSTLLAYADRSRIIPEEYRRLVIRRNGDVLPTLLVDGYVAGVWRLTDDGIEVRPFHPLPDDTWDELAGEAAGLEAMFAERSRTYGRFGNWWDGLPDAGSRML